MNLSAHEGYETALITGDTVLPVATLRETISGIRNKVSKAGIDAGERMIVLLSDDQASMAAVWALVEGNIGCLLVNPDADNTDLQRLLATIDASAIITSKDYSEIIPAKKILYIEDISLVAIQPEPVTEPGENAIALIVYDHLKEPETFSHSQLQDVFGKLDQSIVSAEVPGILLSHRLPYATIITELLWASSRGIPVVLGELPGNIGISQYSIDENKFNMNFTLFYFGSYIETAATDRYSLLFDSVRFADENGFTAVWTPERHFNEFGGLYPNPSVMSAALAVSTKKVQIRSGSLVSPLHHPVRIAEDWALIDNLSNGRAGISFASGWQCDDFIFFPDNYADRHNCMMEQIALVKRFWKGEKVPFKNGLGKEVHVGIFPKPIQQAIPVWITVSGRVDSFIDAGRIGANILTHLLWQNTDELIDKIAAYRNSLRENGFDPRSGTVTVMVHTHLGQDNEVIRKKVRAPLKNYIRTSTQLIQSMIKTNMEVSASKELGGRYGTIDNEIPEHHMDELAEIAFNRFFEQAALLGTVEKGKTLLKRLKQYDVDEVACLIDFGLGKEEIMEGLHYLNQLRECYAEKPGHQPVIISSFPMDTIGKGKTEMFNATISEDFE